MKLQKNPCATPSAEFFSQRSARIAVLALVVLVAALVLWFRFYGRSRRYGKPGSKQVPPPLLPRPPSLIWRLSVYSTRTRIWSSASNPWASCRRTAPPVPVCPGLLREHYRALGRTTISPPSTGWTGWWAALCCSPPGRHRAHRRRGRAPRRQGIPAVLRGTPAQDEPPSPTCCFRDAAHNKATWSNVCGRGVRQASPQLHRSGQSGRPDAGARAAAHRPHHQIRVQFSSRGLPLLGDIRYGSKGRLLPRPVVHAAGADPPRHRQAHRRCLSPAGYLALDSVCMKKTASGGLFCCAARRE